MIRRKQIICVCGVVFKDDVEFEPSVMHVEGFVGNHTHFPLFDSGTMSFIFAAKSMSTLEEDKGVHMPQILQ